MSGTAIGRLPMLTHRLTAVSGFTTVSNIGSATITCPAGTDSL